MTYRWQLNVMLVIGVLLIAVVFVPVVFGQVSKIPELSLFFDSCSDCLEVIVQDYTGRYEYGYRVEHGTWAEEHVYYGETLENAKTVFVTSLD